MIDDRTQNTTETMTPDQGGGSAHLTVEEAMLIAAYRSGDLNSIARTLGRMAAKREGESPAEAEPLPLETNAFHKISVCVLNMLMLDWIEPDELERFEPVWLLGQIERAIREGMLNRAIDPENLRRIIAILG